MVDLATAETPQPSASAHQCLEKSPHSPFSEDTASRALLDLNLQERFLNELSVKQKSIFYIFKNCMYVSGCALYSLGWEEGTLFPSTWDDEKGPYLPVLPGQGPGVQPMA